MSYWLMKSEPDTFGIDDLMKCPKKTEGWDGIRNYQARNMIRDDMAPGDLALFYHSNCKPPGIVGIMQIVSKAYPDQTAFDQRSRYYDAKSQQDNPRWLQVDVKFKQKFPEMITLEQLRQQKSLAGMRILQKGNRLSITPVTSAQWQNILKMA